MEQALWMVQKQQEAIIAATLQAQVQAQAMWEAMLVAEPSSPKAASPSLRGSGAGSGMSSPMPVKVPVEAFPSSPLHSLGSGKSRPLGGKDRKRTKEVAIRMGAPMPVPVGQQQVGSPRSQAPPLAASAGQSPRVVKIAPILGA